MPVFWLGLLLMYALAVKLPLFPVSGREPPLWHVQSMGDLAAIIVGPLAGHVDGYFSLLVNQG